MGGVLETGTNNADLVIADVVARLAELVPPPDGVTVGFAAGQPAHVARWIEEVVVARLGERALEDDQKKCSAEAVDHRAQRATAHVRRAPLARS